MADPHEKATLAVAREAEFNAFLDSLGTEFDLEVEKKAEGIRRSNIEDSQRPSCGLFSFLLRVWSR